MSAGKRKRGRNAIDEVEGTGNAQEGAALSRGHLVARLGARVLLVWPTALAPAVIEYGDDRCLALLLQRRGKGQSSQAQLFEAHSP